MAEPITVTITNLNSPIRTVKVSNKVAASAVTSVAGRVGDVLLTQSDVAGLENVNNTSDLNKPISTATQAAIDASGNGDMLASNNLSDVTNAATSRTNLGLAIGTDVQAHSPVLDNTTASFTTADETRLDDQVLTDVIDKISFNATDLTFDIDTGIGVVIQIGQELLVKVRNATGSTILNGSVVRITGASGNRPTIELAQANSLANIYGVVGIVTADITKNAVGFATVHGLVRDLNTSAFNDGDDLFLSDTVAGGFTNVEPTLSIPVGKVTYSNPANGTIFIDVDNQTHLLEFASNPTLVGSFSAANWKTELAIASSDVSNDSTVSGLNVTQALDSLNTSIQSIKDSIGFACSDETSPLSVGQAIATDMPYDMLVSRVYTSLTATGSLSATTIDIKQEGSSILNSTLSISAGANNGETNLFSGAASTFSLSKGDLLTIDITAIDTAGTDAGLKVYLEGEIN